MINKNKSIELNVSKSKKVLIVYTLPTPSGGMFEYMIAWINKFQGESKKIGVFAADSVCEALDFEVDFFPVDGYSEPSKLRYKITCILSLFWLGKIRGFVRELQNVLEDYKPDLVYFPELSLFSDKVLDSALKVSVDSLVLFTLHEPVPTDHKVNLIAGFWRSLLHRNLFLLSKKYANFYIHIHGYELLSVGQKKYLNKTVVIDLPLPLKEVERTRAHYPAVPLRIGFIGRIEPYKGLDTFYESIIKVLTDDRSNSLKIEVLIAGRGEFDVAKWKSISCTSIIINRYLTREEFHDQLANLDLLVLPYKEATQSLVAALGVTYRVPILSTNVGEIDKLVRHGINGVLVEKGDSDEMAAIIIRILKDKQYYASLLEGASKSD